MEDFMDWHEPQDDPTKGVTIRKSRQQRDEWLEEDRNSGDDSEFE